MTNSIPEVVNGPLGIDVSNHQGVITWPKVATSGIEFSIPKASEGVFFTDPYFVRNTQGAQLNGILSGAYHFLSHDLPAATQAEHFLRTLDQVGRKGLLLPMVDVEPDPSSRMVLRNRSGGAYGTKYTADYMVHLLDDFLTFVRDGVNGVEGLGVNLGIYTYDYWWEKFMGDTHNYKTACPLWLAAYPALMDIPGGWPFASFHQYSDNGGVPGCPHVDLDRFEGTSANLRKFLLG